MNADTQLRSAVEALQPWHFDVQLTDTLSTADGNTRAPEDAPISVVKPRELRPLLRKIYPRGLSGKSFLDVGCNGGGYCIEAKRLGADYAFGFDARKHWIDQAEFLKRQLSLTGIDFQHAAMHEADLSRDFDICLFKGIFYHLPDPVHALDQVCAITREIIVVDTATDGARGEKLMRLNPEGKEHLMTGVHALAWWPSGPDLIAEILARFGFATTREVFWKPLKKGGARERAGRCRIVAARSADLLQSFPEKIENPYPPVTPSSSGGSSGRSSVRALGGSLLRRARANS
jgi:SAM-dependent methyltransferase